MMSGILPSPDEIRALRRRAGLTQAELARRAGVSQSLIARIERGTVNPRLSTLTKILQALESYIREELVAEDIMHSQVIYVEDRDLLSRIAKTMWDNAISQVPVLNSRGEVVGTVLERDIVEAFIRFKDRAMNLRAKNIMSDPLPLVPSNTRISTVASLLTESPALLVIKDKKIAGIITRSDLLKLYANVFKNK